MKATIKTSIALAICFSFLSLESSFAQGRGNRDHRDNDRNDRRDNSRGDHGNHDRRDNRDNHHYDNSRRADVYHHHHNVYHRPVYRPAPVTRVVYRPAPRYVYYSDYNVYYDCHRQVYISPAGPRWIVSVNVPVTMYRVDRSRVSYSNVDYYDDDFSMRLERHEYEYGRRR